MTLEQVADGAVVVPTSGPAAANPPVPPPAPAKPQAASLAELKEACAGAPADFLVAQLEAGATVAAASKAWMTAQADKIKSLESAPPAAAPKKPGVQPVHTESKASDSPSGEPIEAFLAAVEAEMARSKSPRHVAHAKVCRKQPELRDAMVAAHNAEHKPRSR